MKNLKGTSRPLHSFAIGFALLMLSVLILQSCRKDNNKPSDGLSIERNLVINFGNGTIPFAQIDSGSIILTKQGSNTPIFRRFDKGVNNLYLLMDDTQTGNWTAEISVFTKKAAGSNVWWYTRSVGFSLPLVLDLNLTGPTGETGGIWAPHE